jgi:hypothetical protein
MQSVSMLALPRGSVVRAGVMFLIIPNVCIQLA